VFREACAETHSTGRAARHAPFACSASAAVSASRRRPLGRTNSSRFSAPEANKSAQSAVSSEPASGTAPPPRQSSHAAVQRTLCVVDERAVVGAQLAAVSNALALCRLLRVHLFSRTRLRCSRDTASLVCLLRSGSAQQGRRQVRSREEALRLGFHVTTLQLCDEERLSECRDAHDPAMRVSRAACVCGTSAVGTVG
jgi:hypothetical protein